MVMTTETYTWRRTHNFVYDAIGLRLARGRHEFDTAANTACVTWAKSGVYDCVVL